jgi:hypothetical protein
MATRLYKIGFRLFSLRYTSSILYQLNTEAPTTYRPQQIDYVAFPNRSFFRFEPLSLVPCHFRTCHPFRIERNVQQYHNRTELNTSIFSNILNHNFLLLFTTCERASLDSKHVVGHASHTSARFGYHDPPLTVSYRPLTLYSTHIPSSIEISCYHNIL